MSNSTPTDRLTRAILVLTLLSADGCVGRLGRARDPFSGAADGQGQVTLEVQNLNFDEATLYVRRNGQERRVGVVTGKTDRSFDLEWAAGGSLELRADLVGGRRCSVPGVLVDPGDRLWVQIPSNVGVTPCRVTKR